MPLGIAQHFSFPSAGVFRLPDRLLEPEAPPVLLPQCREASGMDGCKSASPVPDSSFLPLQQEGSDRAAAHARQRKGVPRAEAPDVAPPRPGGRAHGQQQGYPTSKCQVGCAGEPRSLKFQQHRQRRGSKPDEAAAGTDRNSGLPPFKAAGWEDPKG